LGRNLEERNERKQGKKRKMGKKGRKYRLSPMTISRVVSVPAVDSFRKLTIWGAADKSDTLTIDFAGDSLVLPDG